jgi:aryl-alcohol dehydrogenase-like predicted oxidoreductase
MKALAISEKYNWEKFIAFQGLYSILVRDMEYELAPVCVDQGLGILTWSPLAGGFLSGKYRRGQPRPKGARLSEGNFNFNEQKAYDIVDELDRVATAHGGTITQASLNYLLCKPGVSSVVVGIRTPEQLADNLKTTDWEIQAEEVSKLDTLSKPMPIYPHDFLAHFPLD